jgi:peroxin-5
MADCGATGSTLDRAAQAMMTGGQKNAFAVLGHAAITTNPAPMPMTSPEYMYLDLPQAASRQQQQQQLLQPVNVGVSVPPLLAPHQLQQRPVVYQPQQQQFDPRQNLQIQQQQQQQMMIMQQQQQMIRMQQQQHQLQQQQQQRPIGEDTVRGNEDLAHCVSVDKLSSAWKEANDTTAFEHKQYDASLFESTPGATIEDLASAWTQAEADYAELEAAVDLASATHLTEQQSARYEFINKKEERSKSVQDWMQQGQRYFRAGHLKEAIRAFEMELQHNNADNATAWRMLGRCHAENDQDREAITCLEMALEKDPYCQEARLALGVSYVNELNHTKALENLKAWITHNPEYAGYVDLLEHDDIYGAPSIEQEANSGFEQVQRLLLSALGVVYNVSRDYDAAVESLQKAIALRPNDYQLYNRLGATLANHGKSEQALPAYQKALQLKPKYARAWLNMAISQSNLQNYDEAARCYLQTLSLNPDAMHCWSYLRIALSCGEHWDLIPYAASMNLKAFEGHFDFVTYQ